MKSIQQVIISAAISIYCASSFADGFVNVYEIPHNVSINVISNQLYHEQLNETIHHWDNYEAEQKKKKTASSSLPLAKATGVGISELTKSLPQNQTAAGQLAYQQAFNYHEQVISQFGLQSGDLGVALASCIAGAWMAYNNKPFPDEFYLPLVKQMRELLSSKNANLQALSPAELSSTYESLSIAGMMMASSQITLQRNPNAAGAEDLRNQMRTQGGEVLTRMLQLRPDLVAIGASGIYARQ